MKWRLGFLLCCAILITLASATVATTQEATWICCESSGSCAAGQACCDPRAIGADPCDDDLPGFCMEKCVRIGTDAFSQDPK